MLNAEWGYFYSLKRSPLLDLLPPTEFLATGRFLGRHGVSPFAIRFVILPSPYISKTGGISRHIKLKFSPSSSAPAVRLDCPTLVRTVPATVPTGGRSCAGGGLFGPDRVTCALICQRSTIRAQGGIMKAKTKKAGRGKKLGKAKRLEATKPLSVDSFIKLGPIKGE